MMESCDIPIIPPNQTRTLSGNAQAAAVVDLLRSFRAEKGGTGPAGRRETKQLCRALTL